ncbi:MAG: N-formylglutamate amidohydrolase [Bdellovibrionaceae bacterium]|nr:N-formylglutamate amidohydrolase [Pseudobdellovibrionaceae bacterium]MDW8189734.1 N-formylglutamate amidohydrolase [Pseudobdellovibrionaceae bacterium]
MLLFTIPHAGEEIPSACYWLQKLPSEVLLRDVDRFVDDLYQPVIERFQIPYVKTRYHRYVVDLNRDPQDIDQESVLGASLPPGTHPRGYHWVRTTMGERLLPQPMSWELHETLTQLIYQPFHQQIGQLLQQKHAHSVGPIWHFDLHSMPSVGTSEHRDPGEVRADVVISDQKGRSCGVQVLDVTMLAFLKAGFKVAYNWPYYGGRITERYGRPEIGHHTLQIELNRRLYLDEVTKAKRPQGYAETQQKLLKAFEIIYDAYQELQHP